MSIYKIFKPSAVDRFHQDRSWREHAFNKELLEAYLQPDMMDKSSDEINGMITGLPESNREADILQWWEWFKKHHKPKPSKSLFLQNREILDILGDEADIKGQAYQTLYYGPFKNLHADKKQLSNIVDFAKKLLTEWDANSDLFLADIQNVPQLNQEQQTLVSAFYSQYFGSFQTAVETLVFFTNENLKKITSSLESLLGKPTLHAMNKKTTAALVYGPLLRLALKLNPQDRKYAQVLLSTYDKNFEPYLNRIRDTFKTQDAPASLFLARYSPFESAVRRLVAQQHR